VPQDSESGDEARGFGYQMAAKVAKEFGLRLESPGRSNVCHGPQGKGVIKTARKSIYLGVLKSMLPSLKVIYGVVVESQNNFGVYAVPREMFEVHKREPGSEKSRNLWFMLASDVKRVGKRLGYVDSPEGDHPAGAPSGDKESAVVPKKLTGMELTKGYIHVPAMIVAHLPRSKAEVDLILSGNECRRKFSGPPHNLLYVNKPWMAENRLGAGSEVFFSWDRKEGKLQLDISRPEVDAVTIAPPRQEGWNWQKDAALRAKVEEQAVRTVAEWYEKQDYRIEGVERENRGWDLEAFRAGEKEPSLRIEVKGLSGAAVSAELTPNEYKKLMEYRDSYCLAVVVNTLDSDRRRLYRFQYMEMDGSWSDQDGRKLELQEIVAARAIHSKGA